MLSFSEQYALIKSSTTNYNWFDEMIYRLIVKYELLNVCKKIKTNI
jgi:hypothetical protein